ncbi:MAG: hypothetical protein HC906_09325 [Bacteroidales bacterium]|nr:hypothetical protein [Bacteroidales bacterium]
MLGNNTELEGRTWANFKGETSLGETSFNILDENDNSKLNIAEIVFKHNALISYDAESFGKKNADLILENGTVVNLKDAGFMKEKVNENGCYINDVYAEKVELNIPGEGDYELEWGKIASLAHDNPSINLFNNFRDYSQTFKLTTKDGQENMATCQTWLNAVHNIKATASINSNYNLLVIIPLYKKHFSKIMFK